MRISDVSADVCSSDLLPAGVIHADLFPDNVFFRHERLTGIIDFYFACNDFFAYDLATCLNAWCFEQDNAFNVTKARMLLQSYSRERPFSQEELAALPLLARGSALRFLLTRLYDWRSEEHTSELQSLMRISYAVFCLKKQTRKQI